MPPANTVAAKPTVEPKKASTSSKKRPTNAAPAASAWRPPKATVAKQLQRIAHRSGTTAVRQAIEKLARDVSAGRSTEARAAQIDTKLDQLLSRPSLHPADAALVREAAVWVVAWRRASKHPGQAGTTASALQKQVTRDRKTLDAGDTTPAAFVLTWSRLLGGDRKAADAETHAWSVCEEEIQRLVTASGSIVLEGSAVVVDRFARWTHVRSAATATAKAVRKAKRTFSGKAERRWQKATTAVLRLLGPRALPVDHPTTSAVSPRWSEEILQAVRDYGSKPVRRAAKLLQQKQPGRRQGRAADLNSDDRHAAVAVFRSSWQGRPLRVSLDYRGEQPHLEIAAGKRLLVAGPWRWDVCLDGRPLAAEGPWQVTHFEEDDESVLIVIATPLEQGLRLERHLLLARGDRFVLLADAVVETTVADAPQPLTYRGSLSVPAAVHVDGNDETRELTLVDKKPQAMLMPLALCEWRAGSSPGTCGWQAENRLVQLEQQSPVRRLFAPLWIDLSPRRFGSQVTWRQLTVADTRVILQPTQAAGFRVHSGLSQWLLYRALDEPRNRTVLGCNLSSFFRIGQLGDDGLVTQMAEW